MGSDGNATPDTTVYPFSIRSYVFGARQQDIRNNWPFHEKYLEVCLKHDVKKLLPPFKAINSVKYSPFEEHVRPSCAHDQDNNKIDIGSNRSSCVVTYKKKELVNVRTDLCVDEAVSEITKQMSPLSLSINEHKHDNSGLSSDIPANPMDIKVPTSTFKSRFEHHTDQTLAAMPLTKDESKRRKKHKKRTLAEIYAETKETNLCTQGATESRNHAQLISENMTNVDYAYDSAQNFQDIIHNNDNEEKKEYRDETNEIVKIKFIRCKSKMIKPKSNVIMLNKASVICCNASILED